MRIINIPSDYHLHELEVTGSTNDDAVALAKSGAPDLTIVWAHNQTKGRGRYNRQWKSETGNLSCSIVVRCHKDGPPIETLSLVAAIATVDAIYDVSGFTHDVRVKWVNDVLIDGAKISGSLCEGSIEEGWVVVGIGVNVRIAPEIASAEYKVASLNSVTGGDHRVVSVLEALTVHFKRRLFDWRKNGFGGKLREDYRDRMWKLGEQVSVTLNAQKTKKLHGENQGINQHGHLVLKLDDGTLKEIYAADLH